VSKAIQIAAAIVWGSKGKLGVGMDKSREKCIPTHFLEEAGKVVKNGAGRSAAGTVNFDS